MLGEILLRLMVRDLVASRHIAILQMRHELSSPNQGGGVPPDYLPITHLAPLHQVNQVPNDRGRRPGRRPQEASKTALRAYGAG